MALRGVTERRMTVVAQFSRAADLRRGPLAVTARNHNGQAMRAMDLIPLPSLSYAVAFGLEVRTPSGHLLTTADLIGKSA